MQGKSQANVVIGIYLPDGKHRATHWKGKNLTRILIAARRAYPGAKLKAGKVWYTNSYGAH